MGGDQSVPVQHLQPTALVVEDHELSRKLLEVRLEIEGFATIATHRAEAALNIAREQRPDLILMDIQLPGISGLEAIKRLKSDEQTKDIPIIAITAFAMSHDKPRILAAGCDGYLAKPFKGQDLADAIRSCMGGPALASAAESA